MYIVATVFDSLAFLYSSTISHSQATDTQEDRSNPVFLYNKMELGDLNANFTIEVDSQVIYNCSEPVPSDPCPASFLYAFVSKPYYRYLTGVISLQK